MLCASLLFTLQLVLTSSAQGPEGAQDQDLSGIPGRPSSDYPVFSSVPKTTFSCQGRPEGFYADLEARCQVFHVCGLSSGLRPHQSFLCPNGTIFNVLVKTCDWWNNVKCETSAAVSLIASKIEEDTHLPLPNAKSNTERSKGVGKSFKNSLYQLPTSKENEDPKLSLNKNQFILNAFNIKGDTNPYFGETVLNTQTIRQDFDYNPRLGDDSNGASLPHENHLVREVSIQPRVKYTQSLTSSSTKRPVHSVTAYFDPTESSLSLSGNSYDTNINTSETPESEVYPFEISQEQFGSSKETYTNQHLDPVGMNKKNTPYLSSQSTEGLQLRFAPTQSQISGVNYFPISGESVNKSKSFKVPDKVYAQETFENITTGEIKPFVYKINDLKYYIRSFPDKSTTNPQEMSESYSQGQFKQEQEADVGKNSVNTEFLSKFDEAALIKRLFGSKTNNESIPIFTDKYKQNVTALDSSQNLNLERYKNENDYKAFKNTDEPYNYLSNRNYSSEKDIEVSKNEKELEISTIQQNLTYADHTESSPEFLGINVQPLKTSFTNGIDSSSSSGPSFSSAHKLSSFNYENFHLNSSTENYLEPNRDLMISSTESVHTTQQQVPATSQNEKRNNSQLLTMVLPVSTNKRQHFVKDNIDVSSSYTNQEELVEKEALLGPQLAFENSHLAWPISPPGSTLYSPYRVLKPHKNLQSSRDILTFFPQQPRQQRLNLANFYNTQYNKDADGQNSANPYRKDISSSSDFHLAKVLQEFLSNSGEKVVFQGSETTHPSDESTEDIRFSNLASSFPLEETRTNYSSTGPDLTYLDIARASTTDSSVSSTVHKSKENTPLLDESSFRSIEEINEDDLDLTNNEKEKESTSLLEMGIRNLDEFENYSPIEALSQTSPLLASTVQNITLKTVLEPPDVLNINMLRATFNSTNDQSYENTDIVKSLSFDLDSPSEREQLQLAQSKGLLER